MKNETAVFNRILNELHICMCSSMYMHLCIYTQSSKDEPERAWVTFTRSHADDTRWFICVQPAAACAAGSSFTTPEAFDVASLILAMLPDEDLAGAFVGCSTS